MQTETIQPATKQRKYNILSELARYTDDEAANLRHEMRKRCGVSRRTFSTWLNIPKGHKSSIPADMLYTISKVLRVSMESMIEN